METEQIQQQPSDQLSGTSLADCVFFLSRKCTKGEDCKFRHSDGALNCATVCKFWLRNACTNPQCMFRHPQFQQLMSGYPGMLTPLTVAADPTKTPCTYFQMGNCVRGETCRYLHINGANLSESGEFQVTKKVKLEDEEPSISVILKPLEKDRSAANTKNEDEQTSSENAENNEQKKRTLILSSKKDENQQRERRKQRFGESENPKKRSVGATEEGTGKRIAKRESSPDTRDKKSSLFVRSMKDLARDKPDGPVQRLTLGQRLQSRSTQRDQNQNLRTNNTRNTNNQKNIDSKKNENPRQTKTLPNKPTPKTALPSSGGSMFGVKKFEDIMKDLNESKSKQLPPANNVAVKEVIRATEPVAVPQLDDDDIDLDKELDDIQGDNIAPLLNLDDDDDIDFEKEFGLDD